MAAKMLQLAVERDLEDAGTDALSKAVFMSSGTVSQSELSTSVKRGGYGAPYGRGAMGWLGPRGPIPYGDPARINTQTGDFLASWKMLTKPREVLVINDSPVAPYLVNGTNKMRPRPIDQRVMEQVRTSLKLSIEPTLKRAFK